MTENIIKKIPKHIVKRSLSRLMAVQILYQRDFYDDDLNLTDIADEVIDNYLLDGESEDVSSYRNKIDSKLLDNLLSGVALSLDIIDQEISEFMQEPWTLDKLSDVMLPILRFAVFELKFMKDTPVRVIISEYVDIAGCFFEAKKVTFVNSILENIARKNRETEFNK